MRTHMKQYMGVTYTEVETETEIVFGVMYLLFRGTITAAYLHTCGLVMGVLMFHPFFEKYLGILIVDD